MGLGGNIRETFRKAFEKKCFDLTIEAYKIVLNENAIKLDWHENDISQELKEKLDGIQRRLQFGIIVTRENSLAKNVQKSKGFADKLARVDFTMYSINSSIEYKYYFEAKRLKENDSKLKRSYIDEGMDRFTSKKYPLGCMLGYQLEGAVNKTVEGINRLLSKDLRNTQALCSKRNDIHNNYFESEHSEIGILKHLILDFTTITD